MKPKPSPAKKAIAKAARAETDSPIDRSTIIIKRDRAAYNAYMRAYRAKKKAAKLAAQGGRR